MTLVLQHDHRHCSDTGSAATDGDASRSVGERADNWAKHHQDEAATQHQPITQSASQQANWEGHERAQHHEGADQCSECRVVELEQPHQVGTERRNSLVLIAKADPGERHSRENEPRPGAHCLPLHYTIVPAALGLARGGIASAAQVRQPTLPHWLVTSADPSHSPR